MDQGYPETLIMTTLSEIKFEDRRLALQQKCKEDKQILSFVTQYRPTVRNLKQILMQKYSSNNNRYLAKIFKSPDRFLQKGQIPKRYTRSSPTLRSVGIGIRVVWACHPHYYHPCLPKMFECLLLGGTFAAKVIFFLEKTQDSYHLLLQM